MDHASTHFSRSSKCVSWGQYFTYMRNCSLAFAFTMWNQDGHRSTCWDTAVFALPGNCSRAPALTYMVPVPVSRRSLTTLAFVLLCSPISVFCISMHMGICLKAVSGCRVGRTIHTLRKLASALSALLFDVAALIGIPPLILNTWPQYSSGFSLQEQYTEDVCVKHDSSSLIGLIPVFDTTY